MAITHESFNSNSQLRNKERNTVFPNLFFLISFKQAPLLEHVSNN